MKSVDAGRGLSPEALFPDEFNRPTIKMGPFELADMARNQDIARAAGEAVGEPPWDRWFGPAGAFTLTVSGREAIDLALLDIGVAADDEVLIVTTTNGPYISRCVTDAVTRRCKWSRALGARTRAVIVIHEFGFPARLPAEVVSAGLPVIEDCAYGLGSGDESGPTGRLGDYAIYSLPKALPVSYGGLLKSPRAVAADTALSPAARHELPALAAHHLQNLATDGLRRQAFFELYRERFAAVGFDPLLQPGPGVVPHSFLVALADQTVAESMRSRLHEAGIISSVFFGGGGYFLPNHQAMSEAAIDYVVAQFVRAYAECGGA
jgi:hypothetical protein